MRNSGNAIGAACAMLLAAGSAASADLVKPDIKLGLWEISSSPKLGGQMAIPDDVLARMPPERRAQMQAMMQNAVSKPRVIKQCMTAEKLSRGFKTGREDDSTCKQTVISSSSSEMQVHVECNKPDGRTTMDAHFQMSADTMQGTTNLVRTSGGKTMTMDTTVRGKWLGADCGTIVDIERADVERDH
jgi:hypothetical protein